MSIGQLFVLEYLFAQALLFVAFGIGLDPRQAQTFGPAVAPVLVGILLGSTTLATGIAKPGYTGICTVFCFSSSRTTADLMIAVNPSRCLGLMTAKEDLQHHYIHWLADLAACMTQGAFYYMIPPYVHRTGRGGDRTV